MQIARVVGDVVSTMKDPNLSGLKMLVLQPLAASGEAAGRTLVALDSVGAGVGELVSVHVIPRPHANLEDALPIGKASATTK